MSNKVRRRESTAKTPAEEKVERNFYRIAQERVRGITMDWVKFDQPLSVLAMSCYVQGFEDLCNAHETIRRRNEEQGYDGVRCTD